MGEILRNSTRAESLILSLHTCPRELLLVVPGRCRPAAPIVDGRVLAAQSLAVAEVGAGADAGDNDEGATQGTAGVAVVIGVGADDLIVRPVTPCGEKSNAIHTESEASHIERSRRERGVSLWT